VFSWGGVTARGLRMRWVPTLASAPGVRWPLGPRVVGSPQFSPCSQWSSQWGQRHVGRRHLAPSLGRLRRRHASHSPLAPVVYILLRHDCFFCCSNCVLQWRLYALLQTSWLSQRSWRPPGGDNANVKEWAHFIVSAVTLLQEPPSAHHQLA